MKKVMALLMVAGMVALYACNSGNKTEGTTDSTAMDTVVQEEVVMADTAAMDTTAPAAEQAAPAK